MSENNDISADVLAVPSGVGSAVGVSDAKWFVARMTRNNVEKATAERLAKQGYETYVATQEVLRVWRNGRRKKVEQVVIPTMVFIHCTESERLVVAHDPGISRFLTDRASRSSSTGAKRIVTIPDEQIKRLKFMLGKSDEPVEFTPEVYHTGDKVRVIRGNLLGLEGKVAEATDGKSTLILNIDLLGSAKLQISTYDLERI